MSINYFLLPAANRSSCSSFHWTSPHKFSPRKELSSVLKKLLPELIWSKQIWEAHGWAVLYCVAQIPPLELEDLFPQLQRRLTDSSKLLDAESHIIQSHTPFLGQLTAKDSCMWQYKVSDFMVPLGQLWRDNYFRTFYGVIWSFVVIPLQLSLCLSIPASFQSSTGIDPKDNPW